MRAVGSKELLDIWEQTTHLGLIQRSLHLLAAIYQVQVESVAALSIGDRDLRLLLFRERIFGTQLKSIAHCSACGGKAEWEMQTETLRLQSPATTPNAGFHWQDGDLSVRYRLPDSADLLRAMRTPDEAEPIRFISACIQDVTQKGIEASSDTVTEMQLRALAEHMSARDPQADIRMELKCPDCSRIWSAPFDIMRYLWTEIDSWAYRLIGDIALLARAFGWNETEVLALSPGRRRLYLDLITVR